MANKKFWLGILVMVLVFGMTALGCKPRDRNSGTSTTPKSVGPVSIVIDDPLDITFLHSDARIQIGKTYEVTLDGWFWSSIGTSLSISLNQNPANKWLLLKVNSRIPEFQQDDPVKVVFRYSPGNYSPEPSSNNSELISIERR